MDAGAPDWSGIAQLVTACGVIVIGVLTVWVKRDTKQVNRAVNHRENSDDLTLVQMVAENAKIAGSVGGDINAMQELLINTHDKIGDVQICVAGLRTETREQAGQLAAHIAEFQAHVERTEKG
jgi:hypothetical protein